MASSLRAWIADHDDRWSFIIAYVGGAVLLRVFTHLIREDLAAEDAALHAPSLDPDHPWRNPEGGDYIAFILGGICIGLIVMAPIFTGQDLVQVVEIILEQILP